MSMFRELQSFNVVRAQFSPLLPQLPSERKSGREPALHLRPIQQDLRMQRLSQTVS